MRRVHRLCALLPLVFATTAGAQGGAPRDSVHLDVAIALAVTRHPQVAIAQRRVQAAEGALRSARDPFDAVLETSATSRGDYLTETANATTTVPASPLLLRTQGYNIATTRLLRSGIQLRHDIGVQQRSLAGQPTASGAEGVSSMTISVPLLRDRGGALSAAPERSATALRRAAMFDLEQMRSQVALQVTLAFWAYRAAVSALDVLRGAEARAARTVTETEALVKADERSAVELEQTRAILALRRTATLGAEQTVIDARAQLGLAMGLGAGAAMALGEPATPFPAAIVASAWDASPERLLGLAQSHRADLAAADALVASAHAFVDAGSSELRPAVRLDGTLGYRGQARGVGGGPLVDALRPLGGLTGGVQLRWLTPVLNVGARGRLQSARATEEQATLSRVDLRRQIEVGVVTAMNAMQLAGRSAVIAAEGATFAARGVEAERRMFALGASTLFNVQQAEDALVNASLGRLSADRAHAAAIAQLRFQTGTLLGTGASSLVATVLTPP